MFRGGDGPLQGLCGGFDSLPVHQVYGEDSVIGSTAGCGPVSMGSNPISHPKIGWWPRGEAKVCKTLHAGSNPAHLSIGDNMVKLKPDLSTKENREYWAFVRKTKEEVDKWPEWKKPKLHGRRIRMGAADCKSVPTG